LKEFDLELWNGFIFIRFETAGVGVGDQLKALSHLFSPYKLPSVFPIDGAYSSEVSPFNWKVVQGADYDLDQIPPGLCSIHDLFADVSTTGQIDNIPVWSGHIRDHDFSDNWSIRNYQAHLPGFDHLPEEFRRAWHHIAVFPYLVFALYPDCVKYFMTLPVSAGRTRVVIGFYGLQDKRREAKVARFLTRRINLRLNAERGYFSCRLQQGIESQRCGEKLAVECSSVTRTFYRNIQRSVPVARCGEEPLPGAVAGINQWLIASNR
jgi:phenylpropionate dioxygenase-like ring-hydroxylating dioxygenase large terminal subunit